MNGSKKDDYLNKIDKFLESKINNYQNPIHKIPNDSEEQFDFQDIVYEEEPYYEAFDIDHITPESETIKPAVYDRNDDKLDYNKTTVALISVILIVAIVIASILGVWFYSLNLTDYKSKESEYQAKLEKEFKNTSEDFESLQASVNKVLKDGYKYDHSEVINTLWKIDSFNEKQQLKDWFNPYSGEYYSEYALRKDLIDSWETTLTQLVANNYIETINSYEIKQEDFNKAVEYIDSDKKDELDYTPIDLDKSQNTLEEIYTISQALAKDESEYNIFPNQEEYDAVTNKLESVIKQIETIYKASLMKTLYTNASEKAQKEFDDKVEELTKQIEEELNKKISEQLNNEYNQIITDKNSEIASLKEQLNAANSTIDSLKDQLNNSNNLKKATQ